MVKQDRVRLGETKWGKVSMDHIAMECGKVGHGWAS